MDRLSKEHRSWNMSRIRGTNTLPERTVRSLLHREGFRFRLHRRSMPGRPDIVLPKYKTAIFVHGCFWHMHRCRLGRSTPKTNKEFWRAKRKGNRDRDNRTIRALRKDWSVLLIWQCETKNLSHLRSKLLRFLSA